MVGDAVGVTAGALAGNADADEYATGALAGGAADALAGDAVDALAGDAVDALCDADGGDAQPHVGCKRSRPRRR